jgi:hypothetical protein
MVGEIAAPYLTARASAEVLEVLGNDRLADGQPSGRRTLGEVANWADEIKETEWGKRRGPWHYDDVPLCETAVVEKYCRNGRCASAQLARHIEILADVRASRRSRNEALKWVIHLAGDIHQPLHAGNRGDRGGNRVQVSFFGERDNPPYGSINLHAIWDVHMLRRLISERGGERAIVSGPIADRDRNAWEKGSIADWIGESHQIARNVVYPLLPVETACSNKIAGVIAVDQAYYSKAAPLIEIQIRKAGIRLARILNDTLGR